MTSSFHTKQRRGFVAGSVKTYTCRCCKRVTRPTGTGDNDGVELCEQCYDLAGEENHLSDSGEFCRAPAEVLRLIESVASKGGDASCWADLKAKALAKLGGAK